MTGRDLEAKAMTLQHSACGSIMLSSSTPTWSRCFNGNHARLFMHAWKSTHAADMIILTEVTPSDLLGLLRWVMNAIDIYFRAVNVKGRRWIPATEARGLVQHCHNMTDSCQLTHRIC